MTLAVRERAGAEDRAALRRDLDLAELALGAAVRHLDVGADPDPEPARARAARLLGAERLVADGLERAVERPFVIAAVV